MSAMSRADARALEELNTAIALSSSMADKPQPKPKTPPDPKQVAIVSAFHQFLEGEVRVAKKESVKDEQARSPAFESLCSICKSSQSRSASRVATHKRRCRASKGKIRGNEKAEAN